MYSAFRPTLPIWKPAQRTAPNTRRNVQRIGHAYFAPMRRYILVNNVHVFAPSPEEKSISIIITESRLLLLRGLRLIVESKNLKQSYLFSLPSFLPSFLLSFFLLVVVSRKDKISREIMQSAQATRRKNKEHFSSPREVGVN